MMRKTLRITVTLANGYSFESTQRELSNEYQHDRVWMVFKDFYVFVLRTKVASAWGGSKANAPCVQPYIFKSNLTLPMLRLLSSKVQGHKVFWKTSNPYHVGIHWIASTQYSRMSTHVPGFQTFFSLLLHHFVLAKLVISFIRIKGVVCRNWYNLGLPVEFRGSHRIIQRSPGLLDPNNIKPWISALARI